MAGTISRMSRIVRAEVENVVSRFEDAPKLVTLMVIDMERALNAAVAETSRAIANHRMMERRLIGMRSRSTGFEAEAERAVRAGNDEEARTLLERKLALDVSIDRQSLAVAEAASVSEQLKTRLSELRVKFKDAKARGPALAACRAKSDRRSEGGPTFDAEPFQAYDRLVDDVERDEIAAEVYEEITDPPPSDDYERLERNRRVEEELTALRKKASQT